MVRWAPYADPAGALEAAASGSWVPFVLCGRAGVNAAAAAVRARLELVSGDPATADRIRASGVDEWADCIGQWARNQNYYRRTLDRFQRASG